VRSDSAARVAVNLGYENVSRYAAGFPEWQGKGLPEESVSLGPVAAASIEKTGTLTGLALVWTLLGIFLSGMALNLTPCIYPLIPITISYFGGRSGKGRGRLLGNGVCYIGGLAVVNSSLGLAAALSGSLVGSLLQNPLVLGGVVVVLLFFASSLLGFWELRLPSGLTRAASKNYSGYFGSLFMGLTLGVIAAPCIGPFILGLLTWVASMGDPLMGFIVFFTLSLGLGIPLLALGLFSGKLDKLPRSGDWMVWVRKLLGWILVGMALYFIRPVLSETTGVILFAMVPLAAAIHLGWIQSVRSDLGLFRWIQTAVAMAGLVTATILVGTWVLAGPGANWHAYSRQLMVSSQAAGKPVVIDFSAEWCTPCRELDEITFHHPDVVKLSDQSVVMIKVDLTQTGNNTYERLLREHDVKGVPTVLFFNRRGEERPDLRLVDFVPAEPFLNRLAELLRDESSLSRQP